MKANKIGLSLITSSFLFINNFPLTTQNIVVVYHINRDLPEGWWGTLRKSVSVLRRIRESPLNMHKSTFCTNARHLD